MAAKVQKRMKELGTLSTADSQYEEYLHHLQMRIFEVGEDIKNRSKVNY